jgi:hypothetical protein
MYREQEARERGHQEQGILTGGINYIVGDALATELESGFYDVIYDKGTFDSIACVSKKFVKSKKLQTDNEEDEAATSTTTASTQEENDESEAEAEEDDEDDRIKYCREINRCLCGRFTAAIACMHAPKHQLVRRAGCSNRAHTSSSPASVTMKTSFFISSHEGRYLELTPWRDVRLH